jgi:hypothetical protein
LLESLTSEKILPPLKGQPEDVAVDASPAAAWDRSSAPVSGTKTYPDTASTSCCVDRRIFVVISTMARGLCCRIKAGNMLFQGRNQGDSVSSSKKFFVRFGIKHTATDRQIAGRLNARG